MARNSGGQIELVLENRQLLVIFLVTVALWGIFFSLGYIVGRNTSSSATAVALPDSAVAASGEKPSPMPPAAYLNRPPQESTGGEGLTPAGPELNFDQSVEEKAPEARLTAPQATGSSSPEGPEGTPPPESQRLPAVTTPPPGILVQVSALSRQEDAQFLVQLLKEKNLPVLVTAGPSDSLYHVVVGPYQTEREAQATKKLLEDDGFQPIIKR